MSISDWDSKVSMLFSLLLNNIRILSCFFFLFLVVFNNFSMIPIAKENNIVNAALAIPQGAPATVAWKLIQTPPVFAFKTIRILSM